MNRLCIAALALLCPGVALADPLSVFAGILAVTGSGGLAAAGATVVSALGALGTGAVLSMTAVAIPAHGSPRAKRVPRRIHAPAPTSDEQP